jgi:hypothetical protein
MFTLEYAKNPSYQTKDHSCIEITVKWEEFNEEMPFGAMANDIEQHGRDLYNRIIAGEFGEIAPYVPSIYTAENIPEQPTTTGSQDL